VFELVGEDPQNESLDLRHGLSLGGAVSQRPGQRWHLGDPTAIVFALDLNSHGLTVAPLWRSSKAFFSEDARAAADLRVALLEAPAPPVAGAVFLAAELAGAPFSAAARQRLATELATR
jgi:hypothetical protein